MKKQIQFVLITLATAMLMLIAYNTTPKPVTLNMALRQTEFAPAKWLQHSETPSIFYARFLAISTSYDAATRWSYVNGNQHVEPNTAEIRSLEACYPKGTK